MNTICFQASQRKAELLTEIHKNSLRKQTPQTPFSVSTVYTWHAGKQPCPGYHTCSAHHSLVEGPGAKHVAVLVVGPICKLQDYITTGVVNR